ncbi:hypothetical protein Agabi119p4_1823 [Agaricus bisporus var. burnettii]|uniref:Conserved oligomeric Golgi complex subunit 5 helical domain-containing protein n=1 Tax=Agaricus bisporus var. burnettii TaxID=192524 RepID=A0A8H7KJK4_AGABI|nr:hypothetical protein Agabi119p4_1823 [Agaricus bisporus var. burnettii]
MRLHKLHQASDVLRRTSRFVILARRLQAQMSEIKDKADEDDRSGSGEEEPSKMVEQTVEVGDQKERMIAKAALTIAELVSLLEGTLDEDFPAQTIRDEDDSSRADEDDVQDISLRSISAVAAYESFIQDARTRVTVEMERMVLSGLKSLNQTLLASSLQTAYNLRVLPSLIQGLLSDLSHAVEERIQSAFDLSKISKDVLANDPSLSGQQSPAAYRSRVRTEPTSTTVPQYAAALWTRLESMFEAMTDCCIRVYTLEKVLRMKKDTITQVVFLDEAMKSLENKPSAIFWISLARFLEKHVRDSFKASTFLQNSLSNGYPRLLRLFHEFFAKIAVHADTMYTSMVQSPETVLVLRSISNIESLYLSRSTNKLNEVIGQVFSRGARAPPGSVEGVNVARAMANELDAARFDPLLVKAVAKIASSALDIMLSRAENLVLIDRSAFSFIGATASQQQFNNAQVASFLYHCWMGLSKLEGEYSKFVFDILRSYIQNIYHLYERLTDPLLSAIRRDLGAIIANLHRIDFGKSVDPLAGMGRSSLYTKELTEKLGFFKSEVLSQYDIGDVSKSWSALIVNYVIKTFLFHASIVKPLGEKGKLQLTSDMTEVEFALNTFMVDSSQSHKAGGLETVGSEYKALRAMRPLLFLENDQLTSPKYTAGLPTLIVLHHILVRSPIPLPHSLHGWQEAEYVRWIDEHSEMEAFTLVDTGLSHWEKASTAEEKNTAEASEYVRLARIVLQQAYRT